MIYTFANRTVGLVGQFETPHEIIQLVISYLGGNVIQMTGAYFLPDVIVIGMNTTSKAMEQIENHFAYGKNSSQIVYEGKIEDHMPDDKTFSDLIDRVKEELPWGKAY